MNNCKEYYHPNRDNSELLGPVIDTRLAMIIDPDKQSAISAGERANTFLDQGGEVLLIGGSGYISPDLFQDSVMKISTITRTQNVPLFILPGHIDQVPLDGEGVAGVLNYKHILGENEDIFEKVYPEHVRKYIKKTLSERTIPDIQTLYVLCGDKEASVSKVSGILPLDLSNYLVLEQTLVKIDKWIESGIDCIFFESGSNSETSLSSDIAQKVRQLIDARDRKPALIVSGGIKTPDIARKFSGIADIVVVGGHFEITAATDAIDFVNALNSR